MKDLHDKCDVSVGTRDEAPSGAPVAPPARLWFEVPGVDQEINVLGVDDEGKLGRLRSETLETQLTFALIHRAHALLFWPRRHCSFCPWQRSQARRR